MLKNSKVVLFLSPQKVGQVRNFWTLLRNYGQNVKTVTRGVIYNTLHVVK